jgi:hypothetical protein
MNREKLREKFKMNMKTEWCFDNSNNNPKLVYVKWLEDKLVEIDETLHKF